MRKITRWLLVAAMVVLVGGCGEKKSPRVVEDFNFDWRFSLGDDAAWAEPGFDDAAWRELHLPHDWAVEGEFSADNPSTPGGGALPGGIGWYRKHFATPASDRILVEFDGVFMNSTVYVNGQEVGTRPYGYSSFCYDITPFVAPTGEDNVIAVRCDNAEQPNSRWYAGCGIYRNVRLVGTSKAHFAYNGLYVTTPEISDASATVNVEARLEEAGPGLEVRYRILDARGRKVAAGASPALEIARPHRWDIDDPYLYTLVAELVSDGRVIDSYTQRFGIRTLRWDADEGFFLNGRSVKLLGACLHHDMGCLGSAVHRRALEREFTILKEMGLNAIRTSHNPPAPEVLDLCDELGILVMDEAFDMWRRPKTRYDYSRFFDDWYETDLTDFILRDRNHPSVILWSIGNEIPEQGGFADQPDDNPAIALTRELVAIVKNLDPTRGVTAGNNNVSPMNNLLRSGALDVYGFNYNTRLYDQFRTWYPGKPMVASEATSAINSRGVYFQPSDTVRIQPRVWWEAVENASHQLTAYDGCRVPWGDLHADAWLAVRDRPWMAGLFIWTGFDYLGEPTPYGWPSRSSYFGVVDLAGFPKDAYWMYQSEWTDKTVLHLFPHWNWTPGEEIDVWAYYSNADEVELFLNGRSLGRSRKEGDKLRAQWLRVPFEAGTIEAVSYRDGKEVARTSRTTTGPAAGLRLTADRRTIAADGYDLSYVTVDAVDADGREVPDADGMLRFSVKGAGELVGIDNGNAADTLSLKGNQKALFSGKALAVVRSLRNQPGTATLTVEGYGTTKTIDIKTK